MAGIDGFGITMSGATSMALVNLETLEIHGISRTEIDVTTHSSTDGWMEKLAPGVQGVPDTTMTCTYDEDQEAILRTAAIGATEVWTITASDGATWVCTGGIKELGTNPVPIDDAIRNTVTFFWTGTPVYTAPV